MNRVVRSPSYAWRLEGISMGLNMVKNYVFLLGDSRTGTTSIHHFLNALGLNSIHYYPNEAKQIENSNATHHQNWNNLKSFILTSGRVPPSGVGAVGK